MRHDNGHIPPFHKLVQELEISTATLARRANISPEVVFNMVKGVPVAREDAMRVLHAITEITTRVYNLANVHVVIIREEG